ncbi:polysaccharide deacetylase family protein [Flavobacterium lacustre]|uniref:polysaccharide deacetylase family protein n=1 Tax=Flavobacterium lacustre TaxID=3016339 RepID=UPI0022B6AB84|nr:polysaccharide deacetylase family protein [Flavobacterium lacustre]
MSFYWIKTKSFIKRLFSNYVWDLPNTQNKIYLTFDDGPTPEITEWVLEELKKHNVKATFFCIGNNIQKHPELFQKVINEGHVIGNHTYNHMNGWKTETKTYLENISLCEKQIQKSSIENLQSKIFRPPYGKIKTAQAKIVRRLGYKIIMWDVLSADFDQTITPEKCLENVISNVKSGSVIVFHDSIKASHNLKYALPETLNILKEKGFLFDVIK